MHFKFPGTALWNGLQRWPKEVVLLTPSSHWMFSLVSNGTKEFSSQAPDAQYEVSKQKSSPFEIRMPANSRCRVEGMRVNYKKSNDIHSDDWKFKVPFLAVPAGLAIQGGLGRVVPPCTVPGHYRQQEMFDGLNSSLRLHRNPFWRAPSDGARRVPHVQPESLKECTQFNINPGTDSLDANGPCTGRRKLPRNERCW